jgi:phosphatidylserine/phosphatidylglycerophosphate/cardiolipin synthase-like enzyme
MTASRISTRCCAAALLLLILASCGSYRAWLLETIATAPHLDGHVRAPHQVGILDTGRGALDHRVRIFRAAKRSIRVQTFILDDEPTTRLLLHELVQAARRGVQVRLLADSMFTAELPLQTARLCRAHPNLELRLYSPESGNLADSALARVGALLVDFDGFNQRMHNKLVVVDEEVAICGGRNYQDSYFDADARLVYRDRDVAVAGPVVERMAASFDQYWGHMLSVPADELRDVAAALEVSEAGWPFGLDDLGVAALADGVERRLRGGGDPLRYYDVAEIAFWVDAPGKPSIDEGAPSVARSLIGAVGGAQRSIWAQSPYLVLSDAALELLRLVRARGVTVQVHTNSLASTDNWPSYAHAMRQRRDVLEGLDLEVFELKPYPDYMRDVVPGHDALGSSAHPNGPLLSLHAKSFVIDDQLAVVGSYNLDPRSEALNTEVLLAVWDREFAKALAASIARDAAPENSWVVAVRQRSLPRALVAEVSAGVNDVLRGVTTLDLWPFAWSAQFELAPGQAPVSRRHPDFYRRYVDVGSFPEVGRMATVVMVELARSLTGFARPLM